MLDNQGDANRNSKGSRYVEYNITGGMVLIQQLKQMSLERLRFIQELIQMLT